MKRTLIGIGAAIAVIGLAGFAFQGAATQVKTWASTLNTAGGVSAKITSQRVGEGRVAYSLDLSAPNKARVDTPGQLLVSDGTTITTYYKAQKQYVKSPFSEAKLRAALGVDEFRMFQPVLNAKAFDGFTGYQSKGSINRRGVELTAIRFLISAALGKSATAYFDGKGTLIQAEMTTSENGKDYTNIVNYDSVVIARPNDSKFTFAAPEGSKEVTEAELASDKWFDNIAEALAEAKKTNRMLMIDFYFDG